MVNLKINNIPVSVPEGTTILEAARSVGIRIPTLCYLKEINAIGACRICVVEVKGARSMVAACVYPVAEGMEVTTNSAAVIKARKTTLELILSDHQKKCLSCIRSTNCELQNLANEYGCDANAFEGATNEFQPDTSTDWLIRDNNKCILCRRCVAVCKHVQEVGVISANKRGFSTNIDVAFQNGLENAGCVACGQCINVCPVGALYEKSEIEKVKSFLRDPGKGVVVGAGAALATEPLVCAVLLAIFLIEVAVTRIVSLGSIIIAALYPVGTLINLIARGANLPTIFFSTICCVIMAAMVIWLHRSNIERLKNGTEYRFGQKK